MAMGRPILQYPCGGQNKRKANIMNRTVSLVLIVIGVALIVFGVVAMDSFSSDVSRFFTGTPTDKSVWMLIAGVVAAAVGLSGVTIFGSHATKR